MLVLSEKARLCDGWSLVTLQASQGSNDSIRIISRRLALES